MTRRATKDLEYDAIGDILVGIGDNVADNLHVGADGTIPVADSTQVTGIRWGTELLGVMAARPAYEALVYLIGPVVKAVSSTGTLIATGVAGVDDATVINAAITAVGATTGTVRLGPGIFTLTAKLALASNVSLIGDGPATYLVAAAALNDDLIELSNTTGNVVADLWMDGNGAAQASGNGININHASTTLTFITVRDIFIYGCKESGILISANSDLVYAKDSIIMQCGTGQITDNTITSTIHDIYGYVPLRDIRDTISNVLELLGDTRALIPCADISGTTLTDYSYRGHNGTALHDLMETYGIQGRASHCYLNSGTPARAIFIADHADFSFGNALVDQAFSVMCVFHRRGAVLAACHLVSKRDDGAAAKEWGVEIAAGNVATMTFTCFDESAAATINVVSTAIPWTVAPASGWNVMIATYDGVSLEAGLTIYLNGLDVSDTHNINGAYVAMESLTAPVGLGCRFNAAAVASQFTGETTWYGVTGKELNPSEAWAVTQRLKGLLGL